MLGWSMHAFRRHNVSKWLGLMALATQLILSFAHLHHGAERAEVGSHHCVGNSAARCNSGDNDAQHCSICWTMALAGSLILTTPIAIVTRSIPFALPLASVVIGAGRQSATIQFQARAPPTRDI